MATYAVSDLHGYYDIFIRGLEEISLSESDMLYVVGDAVDRGPDGIKILEYIMTHNNTDLLIGNHELMMLNSVDQDGMDACNGHSKTSWIHANGGKRTFDEYCKISVSERKKLLDWLQDRYVVRVIELEGRKYCLTHSFYIPGCDNKKYRELSYSETNAITWSSIWREDPYTHAEDIYEQYDYMFITGHVPVQIVRRWYERGDERWDALQSVKHGNLINIDGGCAIGSTSEFVNGAIFLRLDDMHEFSIALETD